MSMLSSQRNRLLFLANELESRHFNMNEYANAMRRAADTIWELRNKLAGTVDQSEEIERLKAENAKLRELVYDMLEDEERGHNDEPTFDGHVVRACKLGVEGAETFI